MRVVRTVAGMLLLAIGLPVLLAGGALWTAKDHRDSQGAFSASFEPVSTAGNAVVVADLDALLADDAPFTRGADTRLRITATTGAGPAFIGIASIEDTAGFLAGSPYSRVDGMSLARGPLPMRTSEIAGTGTPAGAPGGLFDDGRAYVAKLDREDVLFLPYVRYPGELRGSGPLEWVYNNLLSASAMSQSGTELATRGGVPWAVLNAPYELSDPEVNKLRAQWTDSAAKRGGAPAITSGGFTLVPLTISPKEMALLEIREYDEARIAIALGVQPYQLGLPQGSSLTYTNVSQLFDYHWRSFLRPTSRKIAAAISGWALVNGQELRFNPEQYVRPPLEQRVPAYQALVDMGVLTAEEVRIAEDFVGAPPEEPGEVEQEVIFG